MLEGQEAEVVDHSQLFCAHFAVKFLDIFKHRNILALVGVPNRGGILKMWSNQGCIKLKKSTWL